MVDGETGAYQATAYLLEQGFRRAALVTTRSEQIQMNARLQGYQRAPREQGLPPTVQRIALAYGGNRAESVVEIRQFLAGRLACDAVLFGNNSFSISALEELFQLELRIPHNLAVVSFDDNDLFRLYLPAITAVVQPLAALAEAVLNVLLDKMQVDKAAAQARQQLTLPPSLVVRESSLRAPASSPAAD